MEYDKVGSSDLPYSLNEFTRNSNKLDFDNQISFHKGQNPQSSKPFFKSSVQNVSQQNSMSLTGVSKYSISKSKRSSTKDPRVHNLFKVRKDSNSVKPTLQMQISANRTIQVKVNQLQTKIGCGKIVDNLGLKINQHDSVSKGYQTLQENEIKQTFRSKRLTKPSIKHEMSKQTNLKNSEHLNTSMNNFKDKTLVTSENDETVQDLFLLNQTLQNRQPPSIQMENLITEQMIEESPRHTQQNNTVRQSIENFKSAQDELIKVSEVPHKNGIQTQRQKSLASLGEQGKEVQTNTVSASVSKSSFPVIDQEQTFRSRQNSIYKLECSESGSKLPSFNTNIKVNEQRIQTSEETDSAYDEARSQMLKKKINVVFNQKKQKATKVTPYMIEQNIQFLKETRAKKFRVEDNSSPNYVSRKSIQTLLKKSSAALTHKLQSIEQSKLKQFNLTHRGKINGKFNVTYRDLGEGPIRIPFEKGNHQHLQTAREKFFDENEQSQVSAMKLGSSNMVIEEMMKNVNITSRYQYRPELEQIQSMADTSQTEEMGSPDGKDMELGALSAAGSGSGREKTISPKYFEKPSAEKIDTLMNSNQPSDDETMRPSSKVKIKRLSLPTQDKSKEQTLPGSAGASSDGRGNSFLFESRFRRENMNSMNNMNRHNIVPQKKIKQVQKVHDKYAYKRREIEKRQSLVLSDPEIGQFQEHEHQLRMINNQKQAIFDFNQKQLRKKQRQFMGTYLKQQHSKEVISEKDKLKEEQANEKLALDKMNNLFRQTLDINVAKAIHKKQAAYMRNQFKGRLAQIDVSQIGSLGTDQNGQSLDKYLWPKTSRQEQSRYDSKWAAHQTFNHSLDSGSASNQSNEQVAIKSQAGTSVFPMLSQKGVKEDESGRNNIELNSKNKLMKPYKINELLSPTAKVKMKKFEKDQSVKSRGPILSQQDRNATYREGPFGQMRNSLVNLKEKFQQSHKPAPLKTAVPSSRNIQIEQYGDGFTLRIQAHRGKGNEILGGVQELPEIPTIMDQRDGFNENDDKIISDELNQNVGQIDFDRAFSPKTSSGVRIKKGSVVTLTGATGQSQNPTHISQNDRYGLINSPKNQDKDEQLQSSTQRDKSEDVKYRLKGSHRKSQDLSSNYMQQVSSRYSQSSRRSGAVKGEQKQKNLNNDIKDVKPPKQSQKEKSQKKSSFRNDVVVNSGFGIALSSGSGNLDQKESESLYASHAALASQNDGFQENQNLGTEQATQTFASNTQTFSYRGKDFNSPQAKESLGQTQKEFKLEAELSPRDKDSSLLYQPKDSSTLIVSREDINLNLISNTQTLRSGQLQGISTNPSEAKGISQPLQKIQVGVVQDLNNEQDQINDKIQKWQAGDLTIIISQKGSPNPNDQSYQLKLPSYPRGPALFPPGMGMSMVKAAQSQGNQMIQPTYNGIPIAGHQNFQIKPESVIRSESQQPSEEELYHHFMKNVQNLGKQMEGSNISSFEQSVHSLTENGKSLELYSPQKQGKVAAYYGRTKLQNKDSYFFQPKLQGRVMNYSIESMDMTDNDQDPHFDSLDMEYAPQAYKMQAPPFPRNKGKNLKNGKVGPSLQHHVVDFEDLKIVGAKTNPSYSNSKGKKTIKSPKIMNDQKDRTSLRQSQYSNGIISNLPLPQGSIHGGNFPMTPPYKPAVKDATFGQSPKHSPSQTPELNQTLENPHNQQTNRGSYESDSVHSPTVMTTPMITTVYSQINGAFLDQQKSKRGSDKASKA